ncbi:hypothetical protein BKD74_05720 [Corynebacterium diphtheriae]|nr:hypothetical protein BKD74_05720 [Corynebacterium diphtheriae]
MIRQLVKYLYIKVWVAGFLLGWGGLDFLKGVVGCTLWQVAYTCIVSASIAKPNSSTIFIVMWRTDSKYQS